jgi:hypothetical protein
MADEKKISYGDWGYGLQTPIADAMKKRMDELKILMNGAATSSRIYLMSEGELAALELFHDKVWEVEHEYSTSIVEKQRKDRHSGFGRGDSMG